MFADTVQKASIVWVKNQSKPANTIGKVVMHKKLRCVYIAIIIYVRLDDFPETDIFLGDFCVSFNQTSNDSEMVSLTQTIFLSH